MRLLHSVTAGFTDILSLFGSHHVFDYNLFYVDIRE